MDKPELFKMRKNRTLEYADIAPLAYLHIALEGNTKNCVKHLLVDEMQDYSPIQYKVMQKLFPCRKRYWEMPASRSILTARLLRI